MGNRYQPETRCYGKRKFDTMLKCNEAVRNLNKQFKKKVKGYFCPNCSGYHYGHEYKKQTFKA